MNTKANAIWVASYPKSGNTWMMLFLQTYLNNGRLNNINEKIDRSPFPVESQPYDEYLGLSVCDMTLQELQRWRPTVLQYLSSQLETPTLLKLHDNAKTQLGNWLIPNKDTTRCVLHLIRDPRAVAVSWAHHANCSIDEAITYLSTEETVLSQNIRAGQPRVPQFMGSWSNFTQSWLDARDHLPVLTQKYEDRISDPLACFQEALSFIGFPENSSLLKKCIELTKFERLQKLEEVQNFYERPARMNQFFRKGKKDSWQEELNSTQIKRIEEDHGPLMAQLGYL